MINGLKYVVITDITGSEIIYLFPNFMNHDSFVDRIRATYDQVVSAGYMEIDGQGRARCQWKFHSLNKEAREVRDTRLFYQAMDRYDLFDEHYAIIDGKLIIKAEGH